jgi:hypothetical protein
MTHQDLEVAAAVQGFLSDPEGDPTFYRVVGATNGTARLSGDGRSVLFTPALGFTGQAGFEVVADDGFSSSQVATVAVNVSDAKLTHLDYVPRDSLLDRRSGLQSLATSPTSRMWCSPPHI